MSSEHFTPPPSDRKIDRVEVDIAPFLESYEDRQDGAAEFSEFTKRINAELSKRALYVVLYDGREPVDDPANHQGARRVFDEEHINQAILEAYREGSTISDAAARVIASQLHSGQGSDLYTLASTGIIASGVLEEIEGNRTDETVDPLSRAWAGELASYVTHRVLTRQDEPPANWNRLWLGNERQDDSALVARAQKLYDANAHYTAFITEFTRDELVELWNVCGDGITYSFDDEVYDALAQRYNHFEGGESS